MIADRCAAERHQYIRIGLDRLGDMGRHFLRIIRGNSEIHRNTAAILDQSSKAGMVGGDDLVRARNASRADEFIARCKDRDLRLPVNRQAGIVHGRRQRQFAVAEFQRR